MAENSHQNPSRYECTEEEQDDAYLTYEKQNEEDDKFPVSADVSMEELLALQEKIGTKAFSKKLFKLKKERRKICKETDNFKRANKNRPRELPLQRRPAPKLKFVDPKNASLVVKTKPSIFRDPRFDDLSGKLDSVAWKKNFQFLSDMRHKEKMLLEKTLKKEKKGKDDDNTKLLQRTIQKMENQEREQKKREQEREMKKQERDAAIACMKEGRRPKYLSRKEKTLACKVSHFEELASSSKVDKYLQRKEKKMRKKELL